MTRSVRCIDNSLLYISVMAPRTWSATIFVPYCPSFELTSVGWVCGVVPSLCLIHTQWQQPAFVGGVRHQCVTLEIWTRSLLKPGVKAISSTPPPVSYWSSVTGAQCPRPVIVKDEGVLALSNEPSVEMPATNDPWAETHLSSVRAIRAVGRVCVCVCVCMEAVCVFDLTL